MSTAAHHLERSRRYLRLSRANAAGAQHHRAADALRRSVTHAATAVMAAEGRPTRTRRRLYRSLSHLVFSGSIPHAHLQTFRRVHDLPASLHSAAPADARRLLRTARARVGRLLKAVAGALPSIPSMAEILAYVDSLRLNPPADRPTIYEIHAAIPARCNELPLDSNARRDAPIPYDPDLCPNCAALPIPENIQRLIRSQPHLVPGRFMDWFTGQ